MKKFLLFTMACVLALTASAQYVSSGRHFNAGPAKAPAKSEGVTEISYCGEPQDGLGISSAATLAAAIVVPATYAGQQIVKITPCINTTSMTKATVFITTSLTSAPVYTQEFTIDPSKTLQWYDVELTTPYIISGKVYVGYYINAAASDYPIATDGVATTNPDADNIGFVDYQNAAVQSLGWSHVGSQFGAMCIKATVAGELPELGAVVSEVSMPEVVKAGTQFDCNVKVLNVGENPINDLDIVYTLNNGTPMNNHVTLAQPLASLASKVIPFDLQFDNGSYQAISVKVTKVNGTDIECAEVGAVTAVTELENTQKLLVEEGTSTGCSWCPRGIVGLEQMKATYPDEFVGVAIHSTLIGSDPMVISSWDQLCRNYFSGLPQCMLNRKALGDPSFSEIKSYYLNEVKDIPALAEIKFAEAEWTDGTMSAVRLKTSTKFGVSTENATYKIAYGMVENQVGPYNQSNSYAGGSYGSMGGWEGYKSSQPWFFDDVARYISNLNGDANSVPATVVATQAYENECTIPLTGLKNNKNVDIVINPDNTEMIAFVLEKDGLNVLDVVKIEASEITFPAGVEEQSIAWTQEPAGIYYPGVTIELEATATSGLPVTYQMTCLPTSAATLTGNKLVLKKEGTVYLYAVQAGDATHRRATAYKEIVIAKDPQTITWEQDFSDLRVAAPFVLNATASSGLAVKYTITSSSPSSSATISGDKITFIRPATVKVKATQTGNDQYAAAEAVTKEITCAESGIETVSVDDLENAVVFDLKGVQVEKVEPANVYIVIKGDKAVKVLTK